MTEEDIRVLRDAAEVLEGYCFANDVVVRDIADRLTALLGFQREDVERLRAAADRIEATLPPAVAA